MLGFNAVRVAFAFDDNWGINSPIVDWTGACEVPTESAIRKTLVPGKNASTTIKSNSNTLPPVAPPDVPGGICNSEWPNTSTYQRFIWVIDYLISQVCRYWRRRLIGNRAMLLLHRSECFLSAQRVTCEMIDPLKGAPSSKYG